MPSDSVHPAAAHSSNSTSPRVAVSIVAIGRNEGRNLPRLAQSLRPVSGLGALETIYVDSASTDDSPQIARQLFDCVVELAVSPHLNASAGRHVGTQTARGDWIVYLDGDMTLREEFVPVLRSLIENGDRTRGVVGRCRHVYPDGGIREMTIHGNRDEMPCAGFGGAVVLPREMVLSAGNWNPGLYAYEEVELYGRLRRTTCQVTFRDVPFADHHTARLPKWRMLLGSLVPYRSVLGKKYYGAGQAFAASLRGGTLGAFVSVKPGPFIFTAGVLLSIVALLARWHVAAALVLLATVALSVLSAGLFGPVLYATWIPQLVLGAFRYRPGQVPTVQSRSDSARAQQQASRTA